MKVQVVRQLPKTGRWFYVSEVLREGNVPLQVLWYFSGGTSGVSGFHEFRSLLKSEVNINTPVLVKTEELQQTLVTYL